MKFVQSVATALLVMTLVVLTMIPGDVHAAPSIERSLQVRAPGKTKKDSSMTKSVGTMQLSNVKQSEIAQSKTQKTIGTQQVIIYEHVCVETCVYLYKVEEVVTFEVHFHEHGQFAGKIFDVEIDAVIQAQYILDNGCAVVTEDAKIMIDITVLEYGQIIKLCETLNIEIDAEVTTKEQLLVYLGISVSIGL